MPYPKEKLYHFSSIFSRFKEKTMQISLKLKDQTCLFLRKDPHNKMHGECMVIHFALFGLCPNCAQLMNVKGKRNQ